MSGIFISSYVYVNGPIIAHVDFTFCTIYGNTAQNGADIAIEDEYSEDPSQVKISNSIVTGGLAHPGSDIVGMLTSYGYNLFQDNSGATFDPSTRTQHSTDKTFSVNDLTRMFASPVGLQDNGGPTKTIALFPGVSNPAMNKVPLDACHVNSITTGQTDQRIHVTSEHMNRHFRAEAAFLLSFPSSTPSR
jgi:hypothetical protein